MNSRGTGCSPPWCGGAGNWLAANTVKTGDAFGDGGQPTAAQACCLASQRQPVSQRQLPSLEPQAAALARALLLEGKLRRRGQPRRRKPGITPDQKDGQLEACRPGPSLQAALQAGLGLQL